MGRRLKVAISANGIRDGMFAPDERTRMEKIFARFFSKTP
jgi:hypothetical protein